MNSLDKMEDYDRLALQLAKLQDQLAAASNSAISESNARGEEEMRHRSTQAKLDEALARIKASQEQEPHGWWNQSECSDECDYFPKSDFPNYAPNGDSFALYRTPIISREPELLAEIEKLQAQVEMLRHYAAWANGLIENWTDSERDYSESILSQSSSDWIEAHDQQVRDEAYEKAARLAYQFDVDNMEFPQHGISMAIRKLKGAK
jgi:hypothetical protein